MIILTGKKGIGKTTIASCLLERISIDTLSIYTFFRNENLILRIINKDLIIAKRVIKYKCLIPTKKNIELSADIIKFLPIYQKKIVLFDEIGFIEECSIKFKEAVFYLMKNAKRSIFIVKNDNSPFIKRIMKEFHYSIYKINEENRSFIAHKLIKII